jgi:hypothetical protein
MGDNIELAAEQPTRSAAKRRPAHSGAASDSHWQRGPSLWTTAAALLIAMVALAVAVWALVDPLVKNPAPPTDKQIADAKGRACASYATVRNAVSLQTHVEPGIDRVEAQAVAANARLAMVVGSDQLLSHLDSATPPQLAELMRSFAADLRDLTVTALAGAPDNDPGQVSRLHDVEAKSAKIVELCK